MQEKYSIVFGSLTRATFIERPNRFLVRCRLESSGEVVEAHLADPGRLKELLLPKTLLYLKFVDNPKRKTRWSVILAKAPGKAVLVSLQSTLANHLAQKAIEAKAIHDLKEWQIARAEYSLGNARWDFLLENAEAKRLLLEVKSCTLVQDGVAMFPDAVTARGRKHLSELTKLQASGDFTCVVLFVVQRSDAQVFKPAEHIDPDFSEALREANRGGVKALVYNCKIDANGITWGNKLRSLLD